MATTVAASNGDGIVKIEAKNEPGTEQFEKILKQVEYYFGDINLPRDKFLQEEMKKDNGWIPLSTMLKFNRLATITTNLDSITKALQNSSLVDISEDNQKIRRSIEVPLPDNSLEYWQEIKRRTVYMKGFPQDLTLDDIAAFVGQFGTTQNIVMRKTKGGKETPRIFKGSVFVTYSNQEEAKKLAAIEELKFKDTHELIHMMQDDYWASKYNERQKQKEKKKQMKKTQIEQQNKQHYKKGMVLKLTGFEQPKTEEGENSKKPEAEQVNEIKEFFKSYGNPAFVVINGNEATIRFQSDEEYAAREAWKKATEVKAESTECKLLLNDKLLEGVVLEGDEETKYWTEFSKAKLARNQRNREQMAKNKKGKNVMNRKRRAAADKGFGHTAGGPKGKRTVFEDDENPDDMAEDQNDDDEQNGNADDNDDNGVAEKKPKVEA